MTFRQAVAAVFKTAQRANIARQQKRSLTLGEHKGDRGIFITWMAVGASTLFFIPVPYHYMRWAWGNKLWSTVPPVRRDF